MKNTKNKVLWITRTALFIAILIVFQSLSASLGQIVTGSLVNLVLVTAALTSGFWSGITVAAISPFFAFLLGIGPKLIQLIPFIALGNIVYVLVVALIAKMFRTENNSMLFVSGITGVAVGALLKFATLYFGVVKIFIPLMGDGLKPPQVETFTTMFSTPQLITALIGGVIAIPVAMAVRKIIKIQKN